MTAFTKAGFTGRRLALCLAISASACGQDEPAVCAADEPVLMLRSARPVAFDWVAPGDDGADLFSVFQIIGSTEVVEPEGIYHKAACEGAATLVSTDLSLYPNRDAFALGVAPDRTLFCGHDGRFVQLDLSGETAPRPTLEPYFCHVIPTPHGTVAGILGDDALISLWLLPNFPEQTGGRLITVSQLLDFGHVPEQPDLLTYATTDAELHVVDLVDGSDTLVAADPRFADNAGGSWLWAPDTADAVVQLYIPGRDENVALAPYSEVADVPVPYGLAGPRAWTLNRSRTHVLHLPWPAGAPMQAFDLAGQPVSLPLTRRPFVLTDDGGALAPGERVDEVQYARPGDAAPLRLRYPPGVPNDIGTPRGDSIELLWGGELWDVPLSGEPYRLVARGVGKHFARIDDTHLLTLYRRSLATIHLPTGVRVEHATEVDTMHAGSEGGFFYVVEPDERGRGEYGVWWLPPAAVVRPPENCPLVDCASESPLTR